MQLLLEIAGTLLAEAGEGYADRVDGIPVPEAFGAWRLKRFFGAKAHYGTNRRPC